ncbi:MAG: porin [Rhodoferax sp.]|jgi:predicted porin
MKKSLVAVAVLAMSGAAFAQVSISGKLGFSYQKNATPVGGSANHGMQMTDGDLNFAATEDLGGGMSITAASAFVSRGRDNGFTPRDASLSLSTSSVSYVFGSIEKCSRIDNVAGAPVSLATGHDGGGAQPLAYGTFGLDDSCGNVDTAGISMPLGPVTLSASYNETGTGGGAGVARYYTLAGDYSAGPLALGLELRQASADAGAAFSAGTFNDGLTTTRLNASYDLGVAKVGAGMESSNHNAPSKYTLSVAAPLGSATTVGLIYSNRAGVTADSTYFNTSVEGVSATAVGVDYKLGKMTTLNASYGVYSNSSVNSNEYRIRLLKAF